MALFRNKDDERRSLLALLVAMAAHVERNTPQVFSKATTDRLEDAADELMNEDIEDGDLSFETVTVVRRILEGARARSNGRPWSVGLIDALQAINDED